jgi:plastocyanin
MERAFARLTKGTRQTVAALFISAAVVALGGCAVKHPVANLPHGKMLFVKGCASCHTLSHVGSAGIIGPNLDDAFRQDRADGVKGAAIEGLISYWIQYPNTQGVMPHDIFTGQDAQDVAAYVGFVAARPGQDTGALASAVPTVSQKPAVEKAGKLQIAASPSGQLAYVTSKATATPGPVTIEMPNMSGVSHNIAIESGEGGASAKGTALGHSAFTTKTIATVSVTLKAGTYTYFCEAPGHRAAGMYGTITVKP